MARATPAGYLARPPIGGTPAKVCTQGSRFRTSGKGGRVIGWHIWLYLQMGTYESCGWAGWLETMVGAKPALCSRAWFPVSFVEKKLGPPLAVRGFMVPVPKVPPLWPEGQSNPLGLGEPIQGVVMLWGGEWPGWALPSQFYPPGSQASFQLPSNTTCWFWIRPL